MHCPSAGSASSAGPASCGSVTVLSQDKTKTLIMQSQGDKGTPKLRDDLRNSHLASQGALRIYPTSGLFERKHFVACPGIRTARWTISPLSKKAYLLNLLCLKKP